MMTITVYVEVGGETAVSSEVVSMTRLEELEVTSLSL